MSQLHRAAAMGALVAVSLAVSSTPARSSRAGGLDALSVFGTRGSWLDIFAGKTWTEPRTVVASLRAHGVATLYLQTGNYSQTVDVVRPRVLGSWLQAAHAAGIAVVAWYLPSLAGPALDARRALAAIRYRSPNGESFDGFALDIESSIEPLPLRNEHLLALTTTIRNAAPAGYPLGAIIPSPVGIDRHPHYWPGFPYRLLAARFDALLPMDYFSYYVRTPAAAFRYTRSVVSLLRRRASPTVLIHLIGGLANRMTGGAVAAFAQAANACRVVGVSLYAYPETTAAEWAALDKPGGPPAATNSC